MSPPSETKIASQEHEIPDIIVGVTLKSVGRIAQQRLVPALIASYIKVVAAKRRRTCEL